jgi:hypothetical protein
MKTKDYLLIVFGAILVIAQSCAGYYKYWEKKMAVEAAAQKSSLPSPDPTSFKDPFGVQAGVMVPVAKFSESMDLRVEINGSMQGAKYEEDNGLKGRVNMFYFNAPIVVRYKTSSGFFGEAGIQPGYLVSAKDKYSGKTEDFKDYVNKFDFGIPIGVGYEFKNNIGVGLRLIEGLTNINKE